ncbi:MAG: DoxX family protein [Woeseiaceae bacterium]|nr:DoxX family protein [Woeseiaceae bacterium]
MSNLDDFRAAKINTWPILLLRVYTGIFFLYFGVRKLLNPEFADGMARFIAAQENTVGFYRTFLDSVVVPYKEVFAFIIGCGEVLLGVAMILGLATRYAAFAGAFMVLNFWLAKGQWVLDAQNHDVIWFVILIVLGGLHAGRTMGLDARLAKRYKFLA